MYRISEERSFTLLELLIAVSLVSVLLGALWTVYDCGSSVFYSQETRSRIKGEAGRALSAMSRELRQASSITNAQAANLTYSADVDNNGVPELVQYAWSGVSGSPLNRVVSSLITPLIGSVNIVSFSYYDAGNNLLVFPVTPSQVRLVEINVTAADKGETCTMRTKADLRNL